MSKKTNYTKKRLGRHLKRARRIPLLTIYRTHRRIQSNNYARNWRRTKLKLKKE